MANNPSLASTSRSSGKTVLTLNARSRADQQRFLADLEESVAETEEMERAADFVNQEVVAERERQMRRHNVYVEQESLC